MVRQIRIYLDNPAAIHYGGDTVTGKVVVKTDEEEKIRYISTKCRGEANVRWTKRVKRGRNTRTVTYSAKESYFETKTYFIGGPSHELILPPGEHIYNFSVNLPENLPSSFEGKYGHIRYTIKAKMNRPWAFDEKVKAFYTVLSHVDLNKDPFVKEPATQVTEKTLYCCWCRSGPLTLVAKVPATGFVSGQEIPVTVEVDNGTDDTPISAVTCSLKKNVTFTSHLPRKETKQITDKMETITFEPVRPNASKTWTKKLKIPSLPPSNLINCSIIDLDYFLHVKAVINGPHRNLHINIPIKLGTIPLLSYVPPVFSTQLPVTINTPQLPPLQDAPGKFPHSSTNMPPYQTPQTHYPTAPYSSNTAAVLPPSTSQQCVTNGVSNQLNATPSAPPLPYPEVPPPSYEECVYGITYSDDEDDTIRSQNENRFFPKYPTYNLSFERDSAP